MNIKKILILTAIFLSMVILCIYACNYIPLQSKMKSVIHEDPRNADVKVSVHYGNYINPSKLIYNLKSVPKDKAPADVFRILLQFAEKVSTHKFDEVVLSYRGKAKFKIDGDYFRQIGEDYPWQNPIFTMRTFPENLRSPGGSRAYSSWTGGWLGVLNAQLDDFNDFHRKWYIDDLIQSHY